MNKIHLHSFSFEVVTVNRRGEIIHRETKQANCFTETICSDCEGKSIGLDMVYIPGGIFMMGSTNEEVEYALRQVRFDIFNAEKPHHQVTVPFICSLKHLWKAVRYIFTPLEISNGFYKQEAYFPCSSYNYRNIGV